MVAAAARIRDDTWKDDLPLKERLNEHVKEGLHREEILDFMLKDFDQYAWGMRTLDRRLRYFNIRYTDTSATVDEVKDAVK